MEALDAPKFNSLSDAAPQILSNSSMPKAGERTDSGILQSKIPSTAPPVDHASLLEATPTVQPSAMSDAKEKKGPSENNEGAAIKPELRQKSQKTFNHIFRDKGRVKIRKLPQPRQSMHPHPAMQGNYYPVYEETPGENGIPCGTEGEIPLCLAGSQYIRTGPNTLAVPHDGKPHHYFDGEGMIHGVYFAVEHDAQGQATIRPRYMNRWVRSEVLEKTNRYGQVMFSLSAMVVPYNFFKALGHFLYYATKAVFTGVKDVGNGNTALTFAQSRVLALQEGGSPWEVEVPNLDTVGQYWFEDSDKKNFSQRGRFIMKEVMTAHPKIDPRTGEMLFFRYGLPSQFRYTVIGADGAKKIWQEHIPGLDAPTLMHDFAISETHSIFIDIPAKMVLHKSLLKGQAWVHFDTTKTTRFGIIPRYFNKKKDKVRWFEVPACSILHTANAWDEKDSTTGEAIAVCLIASRSQRIPLDLHATYPFGPEGSSSWYGGGKSREERERQYKPAGSSDYGSHDPDESYLTWYRFDLRTGQTEQTTLCPVMGDFPMINMDRLTQPDVRYVYEATIEPARPGKMPRFDGIMKIDVHKVLARKKVLVDAQRLDRGELGIEELAQVHRESQVVFKFGPNIYGGEALFVSRAVDGSVVSSNELDEDDGFLLVYVYDESQLDPVTLLERVDVEQQVTELWIFDAKKIEAGPVAKVKIPRRVPYGFHGLHITKSQILANRSLQVAMGRV
ncbi:Dixin [Actinomortierella ambigua]|nr:Dixin [Actinomortierella ambigua]